MLRYLLAALVFMGCGSDNGRYITLEHWALSDIRAEFGEDVYGRAFWDDMECHIIVPPIDEIGEGNYHFILGHETRHCFEGSFHPPIRSSVR